MVLSLQLKVYFAATRFMIVVVEKRTRQNADHILRIAKIAPGDHQL